MSIAPIDAHEGRGGEREGGGGTRRYEQVGAVDDEERDLRNGGAGGGDSWIGEMGPFGLSGNFEWRGSSNAVGKCIAVLAVTGRDIDGNVFSHVTQGRPDVRRPLFRNRLIA